MSSSLSESKMFVISNSNTIYFKFTKCGFQKHWHSGPQPASGSTSNCRCHSWICSNGCGQRCLYRTLRLWGQDLQLFKTFTVGISIPCETVIGTIWGACGVLIAWTCRCCIYLISSIRLWLWPCKCGGSAYFNKACLMDNWRSWSQSLRVRYKYLCPRPILQIQEWHQEPD